MYYFVIYGIEVWLLRKWHHGSNISVETAIVLDTPNSLNVKKLEPFLNRILRLKNKERGAEYKSFIYGSVGEN